MNKDEQKKRDDEICEKMDRNKPMCCTCKHYLDFRIPEQIAKYAPGEGRCMFQNEVTAGVMGFAKVEYLAGVYKEEFSAEFMTKESKEGERQYLIVRDDSVCDKYESIFLPG